MTPEPNEENRSNSNPSPPPELQSTAFFPPADSDQDPTVTRADSPPQHATKPPPVHSQPNQNESSFNVDLAVTPERVGSLIRRLKTRLPNNEDAKDQISYLQDPANEGHSPICPNVNELCGWVFGRAMSFVEERTLSPPSQEAPGMRREREPDDMDYEIAVDQR
ncbi:MAG: hypothetical protein Q9195_006833 [Heterodermia aff. obscurata]